MVVVGPTVVVGADETVVAGTVEEATDSISQATINTRSVARYRIPTVYQRRAALDGFSQLDVAIDSVGQVLSETRFK